MTSDLHIAMLYVSAPTQQELEKFLRSVAHMLEQRPQVDLSILNTDVIPLSKASSA
jgi:hypothetical protein